MVSPCIDFTSQWAYINDKETHISNYTKKNGDKIICKNGHILVLCNGTHVKKYFRHKNTCDMIGSNMTEWHKRMQGYFPLSWCEVTLPQINNQVRERRADVDIKNTDYIIEMEHSGKSREDVRSKHDDCLLHKKNIIWFIDGNTKDVNMEELTTGYFLITFDDIWKYDSFKDTYNFILLDKNGYVYKIPVKRVINKMILLKQRKPINYVMEKLMNDPQKIWHEWSDDNDVKATLTVQQRGAGNGKTYGIWNNICKNLDKEVFQIVTKQHSAVEVIKKELDDQCERHEYHIVENLDQKDITCRRRKYVLKYKHKRSFRECTVIINTIDSLMFNLSKGDKNAIGCNFFKSLIETIDKCGIDKVNTIDGRFQIANESIHLNKKYELWIDEAQDLDVAYLKAVYRIMIETNIDVVIVGDKLQSLEHAENFITCAETGLPNIDVNIQDPVNYNRRIKVRDMADKINELVNFKDYKLPPITVPENLIIKENNIEILNTRPIFAGDESAYNKENIDKLIKYFLEKVDKEVQTNNYSPNDFIFCCPIMKGNIIATELETKLNDYWIEKLGNDEFFQYAVLHKHEDGQVIDMGSSINSSRIVTIRTSKGDGRKVVFVFGCNEKSLQLVSRSPDINLIYESYLHVALTRAKEKIYFVLEQNGDDIHKRFGANGLAPYQPKIKTNITPDDILHHIDSKKAISLIKEYHNLEYLYNECTNDTNCKDNDAIDWEYHCIRRAIYLNYAIFTILKNTTDETLLKSSQIYTVISKISKLAVCSRTTKDYYNYINNLEREDMAYIPVCDLSHKKQAYSRYKNKIIEVIQNNINSYKKNLLSISEFTPINAVFNWFSIELFMSKKFCETTPITLYNIVHQFEQEEETKISKILCESINIKNIVSNAMSELLSKDKYVRWNIQHMVKYGGEGKDFQVLIKNMEVIGYSKNKTYHMVFITDLNQMNFWTTILKIITERFIIFNTSKKGKDEEKFYNKPIETRLFILKKNKCVEINEPEKLIEEFYKEFKILIKDSIKSHFRSFNKDIFNYCLYTKKHFVAEGGIKSPYQKLALDFSESAYVRDFFTVLHDKCKDCKKSKSWVKTVTDDYNEFSNVINERIDEMCDTFFGLTNTLEETCDEW